MRSRIRARAAVWLCAVIIAQQAESGLRDFSTPGFRVGSQVTASRMTDVFPYYDIVQSEFDIITDDRFKMKVMQPANGVFSFEASDTLINWALSNNMVVRGHTLLYDHDGATPYWVWNLTGTWTRADATTILSNHITTVVSHFRGRVKYYDVVNEMIQDNGSWKKSIWMDAIGSNVAALAFAWAHAADPDAILYWNEQRCENMNLKAYAVWSNLYALVTNGVPVHGFGTQAHVELGWYTTNGLAITSNLNMFAALGLETQITECDVRIYANDGVTRAEIMQQQRDYENIVRACRAASNCTAFVMWGFSDYYSWIPAYKPGYDQACIYDKSMRRKPAYYGVRNALLPVAVEYRCDEAGAQCTNSGCDTSALELQTNGAAVAARAGERGGVSGRPYDGAIDTRGGSVMGIATGITALADADGLTLAAWHHAAAGAATNITLMEVNDGSATWELRVTPAAGEWKFYAATFAWSAASTTMTLYAGTRTGAVQQVGEEMGWLARAGGAGGTRMHPRHTATSVSVGADGGVIDCVRVAGAALGIETLEALRRDDARAVLPMLLEYRFDETGTVAHSSGFLATGVGMKTSAGSAADLHTSDGEGCTGKPGDRAFDNRGSTGMGQGYSGGWAEHDGDVEALDKLWSFTLCAWIKPAVGLGSGAGLVHNQTSAGLGYGLTAARNANVHDLAENVDNLEVETAGDYCAGSNAWEFVAASYDGTRAVSNAVIYRGTHDTAVEVLAVGTLNRGMTEPQGARLVLGNVSFGQRPFDGLLDNVRVYGSKFDASGVLSGAELEDVRRKEAVPEAGWEWGVQVIGLLGLAGRKKMGGTITRKNGRIGIETRIGLKVN